MESSMITEDLFVVMNNSNQSINIVASLPQLAEQNPLALAVVIQRKARFGRSYHYQELNFAELEILSNKAAAGLQARGILNGTKAILMVTPSIEFFVLAFALLKVGAIPVLIDPGMGIKNLKECIDSVEATAFVGIAKAQLARLLLRWGRTTINKIISVGSPVAFGGIAYRHLLELGEHHGTNFSIVKKRPHELAAILFTSGSTGIPKGVEYTHAMFAAQVNILRSVYGIKSGERDLATFPLFSLFGPALGMASIVPEMNASKPITANPKHLVAAILEYKCSNMFVSPALIERLGNYSVLTQRDLALSSLRRVISAGAPARHESIARFRRLLSVRAELIPSYGATEALPIAKIESQELLETLTITNQGGGVCVGFPVAGVDIKIIKITDEPITQWSSSLLVKRGQIREIVVKGAVVSRSYFKRPDADVAAKIVLSESDPGKTGFYHRMGDLGYFDRRGRLWMCGRKAHRVEAPIGTLFSIPCERIFDTHPKVRRTALVGVDGINQTAFAEPVLCVELHEKSDRKLQDHLRQQLLTIGARHDITQPIKNILFHDSFPVDVRHNAKIFREQLAEWATLQFSKQSPKQTPALTPAPGDSSTAKIS